jgi:hypothetical protein
MPTVTPVMRKNDHKTVHKTYINTLDVPHCHIQGDQPVNREKPFVYDC